MTAFAEQFVRNKIMSRLLGNISAFFIFSLVFLPVSSVLAGEIVISQPTILEPVPAAPIASGYLEIINNSDTADRLIKIEADFAAKTQVHEMKVENNIMRMRMVPDGLEIPAGATVHLKSDGVHLMFMRLKERPRAGEARKVTLTFENAGIMELDFTVKTKAEIN